MLILVIGEPGTGKSTGIGENKALNIKGLDPKSTFIIKPNNKTLPFPKSNSLYNSTNKNLVTTTNMKEVKAFLENINEKGKHVKTIIVEDMTHFFNAKEKADSGKTGFQKWSEMANEVSDMIIGLEDELRDDLDIIFIGHVEDKGESAGQYSVVLQTPGKMLDRKIKIQSYFTYILHSTVDKDEDGNVQYRLLTNQDGSGREAKSPPGALDLYEPNDYGVILDKIHDYHG